MHVIDLIVNNSIKYMLYLTLWCLIKMFSWLEKYFLLSARLRQSAPLYDWLQARSQICLRPINNQWKEPSTLPPPSLLPLHCNFKLCFIIVSVSSWLNEYMSTIVKHRIVAKFRFWHFKPPIYSLFFFLCIWLKIIPEQWYNVSKHSNHICAIFNAI